MISHPFTNGGEFLPPLGKEKGNSSQRNTQHVEIKQQKKGVAGDWAVEAMLRYKESGCPKTMEELLIHYMGGYVRHLANRMSAELPSCIEADDLAQSAYFGLSDCIKKYDPDRRIKFESYSRQRVEGAMKDYLRR
jgi:DNA-directed RNA polymerase specialized sigma subunit